MSNSCSCGCNCSCDTPAIKMVEIDYLYLDLQTCDRCIGTDKVLEEVIAAVTPTLELAGYAVAYRKIEIATTQLAEQYRVLSSPTIRVNGRDICAAVQEAGCACCGEISGTAVDCRVFEYKGESYEIPPKVMLAEAILRGVFAPAPSRDCDCYAMPENLKTFFKGKSDKSIADIKAAADSEWRNMTMGLFGKKKEENKETSCCGKDCNPPKMAQIESDKTVAGVKVLGSGCAKCNALEAATKEALTELGMDAAVHHVTEFAQIAAYGVMSTPALVIDGKVISYGKVLKKNEIIKILQKVRG